MGYIKLSDTKLNAKLIYTSFDYTKSSTIKLTCTKVRGTDLSYTDCPDSKYKIQSDTDHQWWNITYQISLVGMGRTSQDTTVWWTEVLWCELFNCSEHLLNAMYETCMFLLFESVCMKKIRF